MVRKLAFCTACLISITLLSSCGLNKGHSTGGGSSSIQITAPNNGEDFRTKESTPLVISGICEKGSDIALEAIPADRPLINNCATDGTWYFETGELSSGLNRFGISSGGATISDLGVSADLAVSFTIKAKKTTIGVGESVKLYVAILDGKGAQIGIPEASAHHVFEWGSPDINTATVLADPSPESGEIATVTGVAETAPGTPILIRVDLTEMDLEKYGYTGNMFTTIPITVSGTPALPPIPGIAVSMDIVSKKDIIEIGETTTFYARFFDYKGSQIGITAPHTLSWTSNNSSIASVPGPSNGESVVVTGVAGGHTNIDVDLTGLPLSYGYMGNDFASKQITVLGGVARSCEQIRTSFNESLAVPSCNDASLRLDECIASGCPANNYPLFIMMVTQQFNNAGCTITCGQREALVYAYIAIGSNNDAGGQVNLLAGNPLCYEECVAATAYYGGRFPLTAPCTGP